MPQARQPAQPQMTVAEAVREGNRWINGRPSGDDFAKWFKDNVKLHDELTDLAEKYLTGVVLISGKEKHRVAKQAQNGAIVIVEEERLVHTPYAKVETRVAYFWDLMSKHEEWTGVIEPGPLVGGGVDGLPPGFFRMQTTKPDGKVVNFVCSTMKVRILRSDSVKFIDEKVGSPRKGIEKASRVEGVPVAEFPAATKMIPTVDRWGNEDPFALMKAETGAVGRALGMAGMLVIPGSGVATAEDMWEAQSHEPSAGLDPATEAAAQEAGDSAPQAEPADIRQEIAAMIERLESEKPEALAEIREWAKERRLNLNELTEPALRGVHRKLSQALESSD